MCSCVNGSFLARHWRDGPRGIGHLPKKHARGRALPNMSIQTYARYVKLFRRAEQAAAAVEETGRTVSRAVQLAAAVVVALLAVLVVLTVVRAHG